MNRQLVLAEWRRARECLRAAEVLCREKCHIDAVSRTYYAALHAAKAALEVHGVGAESHAAVRRLFGLHLIQSGELEREWAAYLGESLDDRLAADYNPEIRFSEQDARLQCRHMRKFLSRIRRYLLDRGLTESELRRRSP